MGRRLWTAIAIPAVANVLLSMRAASYLPGHAWWPGLPSLSVS